MPTETPVHNLPVYPGDALEVTNGANLGDPLSFAGDLVPDDTYALAPGAETVRLALAAVGAGFVVGPGSQAGVEGRALHLDSTLTFMNGMGETTEVVVLVEVDDAGDAAGIYALPLAPLQPRTDYTLVGIEPERARQSFAQVACVSFTRGTRITLASGAQAPIETLRPGDRVLTRDAGPQEIRWIGQSTTRAVGDFAPIVVSAGTLNNTGDLVVSPDHRLFIYQRQDALGAGRPELLIRARHLVNGRSVYRQPGGFVEYFQLLFDTHQIIFAEGIAAESLLIDSRTEPVLPEDLRRAMSNLLPGHARAPHLDFEVQEALLRHPDAAALLRRASTS
ncbi:MAG: Hint domain-containing protein [Paracoccaceae bacterium]